MFVCRWLWFAWKIVLLQYRKQLLGFSSVTFSGCDLLEKSYFCSIANNDTSVSFSGERVVICLKNRTFAVSQTTDTTTRTISLCCDLLEKSYFCSIANNRVWLLPFLCLLWFAWKIVLLQYRKQLDGKCFYHTLVVICLKNRTFAVSQTTLFL